MADLCSAGRSRPDWSLSAPGGARLRSHESPSGPPARVLPRVLAAGRRWRVPARTIVPVLLGEPDGSSLFVIEERERERRSLDMRRQGRVGSPVRQELLLRVRQLPGPIGAEGILLGEDLRRFLHGIFDRLGCMCGAGGARREGAGAGATGAGGAGCRSDGCHWSRCRSEQATGASRCRRSRHRSEQVPEEQAPEQPRGRQPERQPRTVGCLRRAQWSWRQTLPRPWPGRLPSPCFFSSPTGRGLVLPFLLRRLRNLLQVERLVRVRVLNPEDPLLAHRRRRGPWEAPALATPLTPRVDPIIHPADAGEPT